LGGGVAFAGFIVFGCEEVRDAEDMGVLLLGVNKDDAVAGPLVGVTLDGVNVSDRLGLGDLMPMAVAWAVDQGEGDGHYS